MRTWARMVLRFSHLRVTCRWRRLRLNFHAYASIRPSVSYRSKASSDLCSASKALALSMIVVASAFGEAKAIKDTPPKGFVIYGSMCLSRGTSLSKFLVSLARSVRPPTKCSNKIVRNHVVNFVSSISENAHQLFAGIAAVVSELLV